MAAGHRPAMSQPQDRLNINDWAERMHMFAEQSIHINYIIHIAFLVFFIVFIHIPKYTSGVITLSHQTATFSR
jgi:hypothetical protein